MPDDPHPPGKGKWGSLLCGGQGLVSQDVRHKPEGQSGPADEERGRVLAQKQC